MPSSQALTTSSLGDFHKMAQVSKLMASSQTFSRIHPNSNFSHQPRTSIALPKSSIKPAKSISKITHINVENSATFNHSWIKSTRFLSRGYNLTNQAPPLSASSKSLEQSEDQKTASSSWIESIFPEIARPYICLSSPLG